MLQPEPQRFPMTRKPSLHNIVSLNSRGTVDYKTPRRVCRVGYNAGVVPQQRSYTCACRGVSERVVISRFESGDVAAHHLPEQLLLALKREVKAGCSDAQAGREIGK